MLADADIRIRGAALVNPDADFFDGATERHDVLVEAVEQGGSAVVWHGRSSLVRGKRSGRKKTRLGAGIKWVHEKDSATLSDWMEEIKVDTKKPGAGPIFDGEYVFDSFRGSGDLNSGYGTDKEKPACGRA